MIALVAAAVGLLPALAPAARASTIYRDTVNDTADLVSYWRLDETSGSAAADYENVNNGSYSGSPTLGAAGALATDPTSGAVFLNPGANTTDHVLVSPVAAGFPTTAGTIEVWVRTSSSATSAVFSYAAMDGATLLDNEFLLYNTTNLTIFVGGPSIATGIAVNDGAWHHIAATWRGSDGAVALYKDGESVFTGTLSSSVGYSIHGGGTIVLGQDQDTLGGGFSTGQALYGSLDEVALYGRALTGAEVSAHFAAGVPEPATGVLAACGVLAALTRLRRRTAR